MPKVPYTMSQQRLLQTYWQKHGMRSETSPFIREVSGRSGLSERQIKAWIKNSQASFADKNDQPIKSRINKVNGYNLFCATLKSKGIAFENYGCSWKSLSESEKEEWRQKALDASPCELDRRSKQRKKTAHLRAIEEHCKSLGELGHEVGGVLMDGSDRGTTFYVFGTASAKSFFEKHDVQQSFFSDTEQKNFEVPAGNSSKETLKKLKLKVSELFNQKYSEAIAKPYQRMPYKAVDAGAVKVGGLPDGITFRKPSNYGRNALQKILDSESQISVFIESAGNEENVNLVQVVIDGQEAETGDESSFEQAVVHLMS